MILKIFTIILFLFTLATFISAYINTNWGNLTTDPEEAEKEEEPEQEKVVKKECICYEKQALKEMPGHKFSEDFQKRITKKIKDKLV
jgi:hypothetical protein